LSQHRQRSRPAAEKSRAYRLSGSTDKNRVSGAEASEAWDVTDRIDGLQNGQQEERWINGCHDKQFAVYVHAFDIESTAPHQKLAYLPPITSSPFINHDLGLGGATI
jgi:hypothetical protein